MVEHFLEIPGRLAQSQNSHTNINWKVNCCTIAHFLPQIRPDPQVLLKIQILCVEVLLIIKKKGIHMKRNYGVMARKIRKASRYKRNQVISKLGIDATTFDNWRKKGLSPIDQESRPHIYLGSDLIKFLKTRVLKRKHVCNPGEIFCVACQKPVSVDLESIIIVEGKKNLSEEHVSRIIIGTGQCGHKVQRFSTCKDVEKFINQYRESGYTEKIITNLKKTHYIGQIKNLILLEKK